MPSTPPSFGEADLPIIPDDAIEPIQEIEEQLHILPPQDIVQDPFRIGMFNGGVVEAVMRHLMPEFRAHAETIRALVLMSHHLRMPPVVQEAWGQAILSQSVEFAQLMRTGHERARLAVLLAQTSGLKPERGVQAEQLVRATERAHQGLVKADGRKVSFDQQQAIEGPGLPRVLMPGHDLKRSIRAVREKPNGNGAAEAPRLLQEYVRGFLGVSEAGLILRTQQAQKESGDIAKMAVHFTMDYLPGADNGAQTLDLYYGILSRFFQTLMRFYIRMRHIHAEQARMMMGEVSQARLQAWIALKRQHLERQERALEEAIKKSAGGITVLASQRVRATRRDVALLMSLLDSGK